MKDLKNNQDVKIIDKRPKNKTAHHYETNSSLFLF